MSKAEKRYFKLYADLQEGEKQYLKVFDYIDKVDTYDEEALLRHFKDEAFTKKFHVLKNYLQNLILKSTRAIDAKTIDRKIQNGLTDASYLRDKGLYGQQKKMLEATLKLAQKYDRKTYQIEILTELRRNSIEFTSKGLSEFSMELSNDLLSVMRRLEGERHLDYIYDQVFIMSRTQRIIRKKQDESALEELVRPVKEMQDPSLLSFREKCRYHSIMAVYHRLLQQPHKAQKSLGEAIELWEGHPHMIDAYQYDYKLTLSNYLSTCYSISEFQDFEACLDKIESLPCHSFNEEAEQFQNIAFYRLLYLVNTGQVTAANSIIPNIDAGLNRYGHKINVARKLAIIYSITSFYFVCGNYKDALNWCLRITTGKNVDPRKDIQQFSRMLELILHYELGNHQFLSNLLSTTYKSLKKQNVMYDYEEIIIKYLRKIPFTPDKKEQLLFFKYFKADLQKLVQDFPEQKPLGIIEINIWLDAKIKNEKIERQYLESIKQA